MRNHVFLICMILTQTVWTLGFFSESRLSLPFNVSAEGFDTGVVVSNPSGQTGPITFRLFATGSHGEVASHTLQSSMLAIREIGVGLDADGNLGPGATFRVLASELAAAAGLSEFRGSLEILAGFPQARAVNLIHDRGLTTSQGFNATPLGGQGVLQWSVKYSCGFDSTFRVGLFFTDINIHNYATQPVQLTWKTVSELDTVISTGVMQLPANGVLDTGCGEEPFDMPFAGPAPFGGGKGFVELTASQPLRVVAVYKNLEPYETRSEKGFVIAALVLGGSASGKASHVYASEIMCGNATPRRPSSLRDLVELVPPGDLGRVWRPGFVWTNVLIHNPTDRSVQYSYDAIDTNGEKLVRSPWLSLPPHGVARLDCSLLPEQRLSEGFIDGFFAIHANSGLLIVIFDKEDYNSEFSVTMHVEYVTPNPGLDN